MSDDQACAGVICSMIFSVAGFKIVRFYSLLVVWYKIVAFVFRSDKVDNNLHVADELKLSDSSTKF